MKWNKRICSLFIIFIIIFFSSIIFLNTVGYSSNIVYAADGDATISANSNTSDLVKGLQVQNSNTINQIQTNLDTTIKSGQLITELGKLSKGIAALGFAIGAFIITITGFKFLRTSKGDIAAFFKAREDLKNAFIALIFFIFIPFFTTAVGSITFPTTLNYSINSGAISSGNSGSGNLKSVVMGSSYLNDFVKTFPDEAASEDVSKTTDALSKVGDKASGDANNSTSSSFVSGLTGLVLDAFGGILILFVYMPLKLIDLLLGFICFAPISINPDFYTKEVFTKLIPKSTSLGTMNAFVGSVSGSLNSLIAEPLANALKTFAAACNIIYYCIQQLCFNAINIMCYYYAFMFLLGKTKHNVAHFLKYFAEGIFGMAFAPLIVQALLDLDIMISTDIISLAKKSIPGYSFLAVLPDVKATSGTLLIIFSIMLAVCILLLCKTFFIRKIEITICYMFSPAVFFFHMGAFNGRDPVKTWFKRLVSSIFVTTIYVPFFVIAQLLILVAQSVSNNLIATLLLYVFIIALLLGMNKAAKEVPAILGLHSEALHSAGDTIGKFSSINGIKGAFNDTKDMMRAPVSLAKDVASTTGKVGLGAAKATAETLNAASFGALGRNFNVSAKGVDNAVANLGNKHKQFKDFLKNKDDLSADRRQEFFNDFFSAGPKDAQGREEKQSLIDVRENAYKENEQIENQLSDLTNIGKAEEDVINKELASKNGEIDNEISKLTGEKERKEIGDFLDNNKSEYERIKEKEAEERTDDERALMYKYDNMTERLKHNENEEQMRDFINNNKAEYDRINLKNAAERTPEEIALLNNYMAKNAKLNKINSLRKQSENNKKEAQDKLKRLRVSNKKQKMRLMDKHSENQAIIQVANKKLNNINAANMDNSDKGEFVQKVTGIKNKVGNKVGQVYVNANMSKTAEGISNVKNGDVGEGLRKVVTGQIGLNGSDKDVGKYTKVEVQTPNNSKPIISETNRYQSNNTPRVESNTNVKNTSKPFEVVKNKYVTNTRIYQNMDPGLFKSCGYGIDVTANVAQKGIEAASKIKQKGTNLLNYFDAHKK